MEMKIILRDGAFQEDNIERLKTDGISISLLAFVGSSQGYKSNQITIEFEEQVSNGKNGCVWVDLNRNEAIYLKHALEAFIEEQDIDPNKQD